MAKVVDVGRLAALKKQLAASAVELEEVNQRYQIADSQQRAASSQLSDIKKDMAEILAQFADLKTRLHAAETSNQYMRGYLARVQEDDTVREELIVTGDPGGEHQLVPKRKPVKFLRPDDFTYPDSTNKFDSFVADEERRKRAKHWITY